MRIAEFRQKVKLTVSEIISDESGAVTDLLLCDALGVERGELLAMLHMNITNSVAEKVASQVNRLAKGTPVQYILGYCYFYGKRIAVGSGCFIPRQDTEILVKAACGVIGNDAVTFADICSGSGCIALAIASENPNAKGYALELSRKALAYAEKNLESFDNVVVRRFDALDEEDYMALAEQSGKKFDLIVSNPPYIPTEQIPMLDPQVQFEPETALDGGEDGLKFYREIIRNAPVILKDNGTIIFEVGINQAKPVSMMLELNGYTVAVLKDYGKIDRVVLGKKY